MKSFFIYLVIILASFSVTIEAQGTLTLDNNASSILITGTSNVHDWEMTATGMTASLRISQNDNGVSEIAAAGFTLPVKNIKSQNTIMDKKTRDAIKADKYKTIQFNLSDVQNYEMKGNQINGVAKGLLTIAGKSNEVTVPFKGNINEQSELKIEGSKEIKLKEFDVKPPTAMMGTLKTGDSVNVLFTLQFTSNY